MDTFQISEIDVFEALVSTYQRQIQDMRSAALAEAMRREGLPAARPEAELNRERDVVSTGEEPVQLGAVVGARGQEPEFIIEGVPGDTLTLARTTANGTNRLTATIMEDESLRLSKEVRWPTGEKRTSVPRNLLRSFLSVYEPVYELPETASPKVRANGRSARG